MSAFVIYIVAVTTIACALASVARTLWRDNRELREVLEGTRLDLIGQLREAENFRIAAEQANDGIVIQDMEGRILWPNPAYCRIVRMKPEEIIGRNPLEFVIPEAEKPGAAEIAAFRYDRSDPTYKGLVLRQNRRSDGELFWNQHSVSFHRDSSGEERAILVCRDVTEQIEHQERLRETRSQLEYAATHDILTGLANRSELLRFVRVALADCHADGTGVGMLHIDVDNFKEINDTHGHSAGDHLLEHVAGALRDGSRATDLAARLGGDEFVVVCPGVVDLAELAGIGEKLLKRVAVPVEWREVAVNCRCSIGAALSHPGIEEPEDLMLHSDFALYEAKQRGRNRVEVYDEELHRRHSAQIRRGEQLREAVEADALIRQYQPKFDMTSGRVCGFETLVRWQRADGSLVPPDSFLPLAERLGLMGELDLGSMQAALDMKDRLNWAGYDDIAITFNASHALLTHPDFIPVLIRGVEARRIDRRQVVIEVLETTIFGAPGSDSPEAMVIADLRAAGFRVMLDDFGVGHAGLGHFTRLDITGVKIDRALIRDILHDPVSARVVETITGLCRDLDLEVIAEGVESEQMARRLHAMGCPVLQGYWIGRPMNGEDVLDWLASRHGTEQIRAIS